MKELITFLGVLFIVNSVNARPFDETLNFTMRYGIIKGGKVTITAKPSTLDNKSVVHLKMRGMTVGLTGSLYNVDNTYECDVSSDEFLPVKAKYSINEQDHHLKNEVWFYNDEGKLNSQINGWHEAEKGTLDIASLIYNLRFSNRLNNLKQGQILTIPFWDIDKMYEIKLKYSGKETIKSKIGTVRCMKIEPVFEAGSAFSKKEPLTIWITDDPKKLPVLMKLNFKFGSVKCELEK